MPSQALLDRFIARVEAGAFVEAMEEFYAADASMQENDQAPRAGLPNLIAHERQSLSRTRSVTARCVRPAFVDGEHAVIRWVFDFEGHDGTRVRLDELAYQRWQGDRIASEKFFYDPAQMKPAARTAAARP